MKRIQVRGLTGNSPVMIGEKLANLKKYIPTNNVVIITDTNVLKYYGDYFSSYEIIPIGTGETIKNLNTAHDIYEKLVALEADRSYFIVGIGGGIVCDITGFVASTYLRGVRFAFVSTTLLSQVDASVGGKNGVNFKGYKNMVGTFSQPEFVICDTNLLKTLPQEEILSGLGEIVKHAVLGDANLFSYLETHYQNAVDLETEVIEKLVYDSVLIKASIVNRDEREKGDRRKLNFGHTFGHAIEKITSIPHGKAISIGMVAAAKLSGRKGLLPSSAAVRIENLLKKLNLPVTLRIDKKEVLNALKKDKKRSGKNINFVLLANIGTAVVKEVPIKELAAAFSDLF